MEDMVRRANALKNGIMLNIIYKYPILLLSLIMTIMAGCSVKEEVQSPSVTSEENIDFSFKVAIPELEQETMRTKAQTAEETKIKSVDFLVFKKAASDPEYRYAYHVSGGVLSSTNPMARFKARLKSDPLPSKIYIIANAKIPADMTEPVAGTLESNVKANLSLAATPGVMSATGIPMWGEYEFPSGISVQHSREVGGIKMFRTMAKVTIDFDPALSGHFVHTGLYIARARSNSSVVPGMISASGMVTGVNIPSGVTGLAPINIMPLDASFYLPEDNGYATANELATGAQSKNNTAIIVAGRLNGGPETFHRIDVQQDGFYGRIIRNHHYKIHVKSVKGEGVTSLSDALELTRPTMVYDVRNYNLAEGLKTIVFDEIEQLSAAEKQIILPPDAGTVEVPVNPGEINTSVEIARFDSGTVVGSFGSSANLTEVGALANIVFTSGKCKLSINSGQNSGTLDKTDNLILQTPTKTIVLNVVKKSHSTTGISAVVEGSLNPQKAEFTADGGEKIITITSDTEWKLTALSDWIKAEKLDENKLKISIVGTKDNMAREHIFYIENTFGKKVAIIVSQEYGIEWSKGFLRGGKHSIREVEWRFNIHSPTLRFDVSVTPQNSPKTFATNAGDVFFLPSKVKNPEVLVGQTTIPNIYFQYDNSSTYYIVDGVPEHYDMVGDRYNLDEAKEACPEGWRLPTYNEVRTLINNLQYNNEALYLVQKGENIYFPSSHYYFNGGGAAFHIANSEGSLLYYFAEINQVAMNLKNLPRKMSIGVSTQAARKWETYPIRCVR